jgi:hypothetical protein
MTLLSDTIYAAVFGLAIVFLWIWAKRRNRMRQMVRRAVSAMTKDDSV